MSVIWKGGHELCDNIQCPECREIPMTLRIAIMKILVNTKKECNHPEGYSAIFKNEKCVSKKCLTCGVALI